MEGAIFSSLCSCSPTRWELCPFSGHSQLSLFVSVSLSPWAYLPATSLPPSPHCWVVNTSGEAWPTALSLRLLGTLSSMRCMSGCSCPCGGWGSDYSAALPLYLSVFQSLSLRNKSWKLCFYLHPSFMYNHLMFGSLIPVHTSHLVQNLQKDWN